MGCRFLSLLVLLFACGALQAQQPQKEKDTTSYNIENLVVKGKRSFAPLKLSPITTQVIGAKVIQERGYSSLQQILTTQTAGLNIQKSGFGSELSMQGIDARHILFLVDGERLSGEMAGNPDYERFNVHSIDHIEIVKGGGSTLYGSRATGAVINLISKQCSKPFSVEAGVRYGQMNRDDFGKTSRSHYDYMFERHADIPNTQAWVSAGANKGKISSQTDALFISSDAFYMFQEKNCSKLYTREANPFLTEDVIFTDTLEHASLGVEGSVSMVAQQKIRYNASGRLQLLLYGGTFFMNSYDLIRDMNFTQSKDYNGGFKLFWNMGFDCRATFSLHGDFYDRFKRHERIDMRNKVYDSRIIQPRLSVTCAHFVNHSIIFGVEHTGDRLTSDRFVSNKMTSRELKETECFVQDEWQVTEDLLCCVGVRTNFSKAYGFMGMPKISLKYSLSPVYALRFTASHGYRSPSIKELFFNWDNMGMFTIKGNEKLEPEKNNYFSFGFEHNSPVGSVSVTAYANLFRNKIEGLWKVYDMQYNYEYCNVERQRLLGVDVMAFYQLGNFLANASYAYVNVQKVDGLMVSTSAPHSATASVSGIIHALATN